MGLDYSGRWLRVRSGITGRSILCQLRRAVYAAASLAENAEIAFNAGSHTEVIKLAYKDFERLVKPKVVSFTTWAPGGEGVTAVT